MATHEQALQSPPALLVIDLQRDFFDEKSGVGHLEKATGIPATRRLLDFARCEQWQVFHSITVHSSAASLPPHLRRMGVTPYCVDASNGAGIVEGLYKDNEPLVVKQGYSAFAGTNLEATLSQISELIITGIAADCCVLQTAHDAAKLGKRVYVPFQAIGASGINEYAFGLIAIAKSCGFVIDMQDLLRCQIPAPRLSLPVQELKDRLVRWYQPHLDILASTPTLHDLQVDDALRALEQRFSAFLPA